MNINEKEIREILDTVSACYEKQNGFQSYLSSFVVVFVAVIPTLLRIMERIDPKDKDIRCLIELFEINGFNFTQFKKKAEEIARDNPDDDHDEIEMREEDFVLNEAKDFANVIRRAYGSIVLEDGE